jgi:hypothetical protein
VDGVSFELARGETLGFEHVNGYINRPPRQACSCPFPHGAVELQ